MTGSAVLFDLDGTLVDTPALLLESFEAVCGARGVEIDRTFARSLIGKPLDILFPLLLPGADEQTLESAVADFRAHFSAVSLPRAKSMVFPGMDALLSSLRSEGVLIGVVTSKITASAVELLEASGLSAYFSTVVGHDLALAGKPAPDLAWLAADRLDVASGEIVVVGDSVDDIGMALGAGMRPIGVTWGVSAGATLRVAGALHVVSNVPALDSALHACLTHEPSLS